MPGRRYLASNCSHCGRPCSRFSRHCRRCTQTLHIRAAGFAKLTAAIPGRAQQIAALASLVEQRLPLFAAPRPYEEVRLEAATCRDHYSRK